MDREIDDAARSLNDAWNAATRGDVPRPPEEPLMAGVRRLHALDAPPALSRDRRDRIWREVVAVSNAAMMVDRYGVDVGTGIPDRPAAVSGWRALGARWRWRAPAHVASAAMVAGTLALAALMSAHSVWVAEPDAGPGARMPVLASPAVATPTAFAIEPMVSFTAEKLPIGFAWTGFVRATYPPGVADPMATLTGPDIARVESGHVAVAADVPVLVARADRPAVTPQASGTPALAPETNPVLGPGDWVVVDAGIAHAFVNASREGEPTPAEPAVILETMVVDAMLTGNVNPDVDWYPLRSESGSRVPPAPAVVAVGEGTLPAGAGIPAPPAGVLQVIAPEKDDSALVKVYTDGSARNTGDRPAHVYVLTVTPLQANSGANGTPAS